MKLRTLSLISACCAVLTLAMQSQFSTGKAGPRAAPSAEPRTPREYRRAPEQTFLTFPEWYLVYSPDEYADFIAKEPPSAFPYLGHLGQFWQGYGAVYDAVKDDYPVNADYHVMIVVIGTSTSVEYGLKWAYETVVGRVAEASRMNGMTAEDRLAAEAARAYVDFLDVEPWYRFEFVKPLKRLWTETGWWGPDSVRKWERKYFLTSEYAAKAVYGWVIKTASESSYEEEKPVTTVLLDRLPTAAGELADLKVLHEYPDGTVLANVPRYQAFTRYARVLAQSGVKFLEIAGNQEVILVSAIVPADFDDAGFQMLMKQPILTRPGRQRIAFTVAVPELGARIKDLDRPQFRLEHVYDY